MEVWTPWGCVYGKGSIEISMIQYVSCFFPIQIILNIPRNRWFTRKFTHTLHMIYLYTIYIYYMCIISIVPSMQIKLVTTVALPDLPGAERPAEETHPKVQYVDRMVSKSLEICASGCDTYINNIFTIYNIYQFYIILSTYQESRGYFIEIYTKGMYCDGWIWKNTSISG